MFIYYKTKYEYIYVAGNLFMAAIVRHYQDLNMNFRKVHVLWNRNFKGQARFKMATQYTTRCILMIRMYSMINVM